MKDVELKDLSSIKGMTFVHLNIRSLINKIDLVRHMLSDSNIDCLCLSETWLREVISDELIRIEGYRVLRADRHGMPKSKVCGGGGYGVNFTEFNQKDIETLSARISGPRMGVFICTTIYCPPKGSVELAVSVLSKLTAKLQALKDNNLIIHGDFNIDYLKTRCRWQKKWKEWELHSGLQQTIKSYTRISPDTSTLIDLCFTNIRHIRATSTLNFNISDYLATFIVRKKARRKSVKVI